MFDESGDERCDFCKIAPTKRRRTTARGGSTSPAPSASQMGMELTSAVEASTSIVIVVAQKENLFDTASPFEAGPTKSNRQYKPSRRSACREADGGCQHPAGIVGPSTNTHALGFQSISCVVARSRQYI